jgi:hypothetical protein
MIVIIIIIDKIKLLQRSNIAIMHQHYTVQSKGILKQNTVHCNLS